MTHEEMIAVIHAHKHGAVIEWKSPSDLEWSGAPNPTFNFGHYDYRVAPAPAALRSKVGHDPAGPRDDSDRAYTKPIGYLPAHELGRLHSGHDANLRSAKFGPSELDGDVPVYIDLPRSRLEKAVPVQQASDPDYKDLFEKRTRERDAVQARLDKYEKDNVVRPCGPELPATFIKLDGPIDANRLERLAKERPDECFLKGSGILKLTDAIRQLEKEVRHAAPAQKAGHGDSEQIARVAELDRASAAQGEPVEWLYRVPGTNGTWHHTTSKAFVEEFPEYGYEGRAIYAAPPSPDTEDLIEKIASGWDGCMYDGVGGMIDIGESIRARANQEKAK